jgi:hypothetical protein
VRHAQVADDDFGAEPLPDQVHGFPAIVTDARGNAGTIETGRIGRDDRFVIINEQNLALHGLLHVAHPCFSRTAPVPTSSAVAGGRIASGTSIVKIAPVPVLRDEISPFMSRTIR